MILNTVVYLDLVILSTLMINYLFIKAISIFLKKRLTFIRMFFALLISVGSLLLFLVPLKYIYNLRYFIGIVIGAVAFKGKENKLLSISILYLLNLCFVGTLVVFRIDNYTLLFISSLLVILIYSIQFMMKKMINNKSLEYNVLICDKSYVGYLDSGNKARYQGKPIIFINKNYYNDSFT